MPRDLSARLEGNRPRMPDPAPSSANLASTGAALLGPDDPPPFEILHPERRAPLLIICDHASRAMPRALGRLGLDETLLMRHIGWGICAAERTRRLAALLDAPAGPCGHSRPVLGRHPRPRAPTP